VKITVVPDNLNYPPMSVLDFAEVVE
jgi:hypothetical protein